MSNDFYNVTGTPTQAANLTSPPIRSEFAAIAAGFDKQPTLTGNAYKIVYVNASGTALAAVGGTGLLKLSTTGIPSVATPGTDYVVSVEASITAASAAAVADADHVPFVQTSIAGALKKITWANVKATLKTYFDTLYLALAGGTLTGKLIFKSGLNNIASAATVDLTVVGAGNTVHITGATGIGVWTMTSGQVVDVVFDGALLLTHSATTNNLPGAANITTAAGDRARLWYDGTTVWCLTYTRAAVNPLVAPGTSGNVLTSNGSVWASTAPVSAITLGTPVATTSGTAIDFTGIPSTAKRVTVNLNAVSTNAVSNFLIQIGKSGGVETSGYVSLSSVGAAIATSTAGFIITRGIGTATGQQSGTFILSLENSSTNTWCGFGNIYCSNAPEVTMNAGIKSLAGVLDRVRLTSVSGDTFDNGEVNISWE